MNYGRTLLILLTLFPVAAQAVPPAGEGTSFLEVITNLRMKQQQEETAVRVVQPVVLQQEDTCSPVQQIRQRIRDVGGKENRTTGNVNITAGHSDVTIDSNSGTVDNSVNVQIVNPNERRCL